jgi:hypothetical protein
MQSEKLESPAQQLAAHFALCTFSQPSPNARRKTTPAALAM